MEKWSSDEASPLDGQGVIQPNSLDLILICRGCHCNYVTFWNTEPSLVCDITLPDHAGCAVLCYSTDAIAASDSDRITSRRLQTCNKVNSMLTLPMRRWR